MDNVNTNAIDEFMFRFCNDAKVVLTEYDELIKKNMLSSNKDFYQFDAKGIGVFSITEPIIKFLIYTHLSHKYRMLPERTFYGNKKLLDLALFCRNISNEEITNKEWEPDIAIEMKWAGVRKDGDLNNGWLNNIKTDIEKLTKCNIENKYFMLFSVTEDEKVINRESVEAAINKRIDKRKVRNKKIKIIFSNNFETMGFEVEDKWHFYIHLGKIISL